MAGRIWRLAMAASFLATGLLAHHSFGAEYDATKPITITGVVTKIDWTNPHTFIWMDVLDPTSGVVEHWSVEGMSPNYLSRNGWSRHTLKPGDKIDMSIHLLKDGRKGGFCATVTLPDGKTLRNLPGPPPKT